MKTRNSRKLTLANEFVARNKLALFLLRKNLFPNKEILRVSLGETREATAGCGKFAAERTGCARKKILAEKKNLLQITKTYNKLEF